MYTNKYCEDEKTALVRPKFQLQSCDILEKERKASIKRFNQNEMIANPEKFQAMVLGRPKQKKAMKLKINGAEIKSQYQVEIGNELNFDNHISNIC